MTSCNPSFLVVISVIFSHSRYLLPAVKNNGWQRNAQERGHGETEFRGNRIWTRWCRVDWMQRCHPGSIQHLVVKGSIQPESPGIHCPSTARVGWQVPWKTQNTVRKSKLGSICAWSKSKEKESRNQGCLRKTIKKCDLETKHKLPNYPNSNNPVCFWVASSLDVGEQNQPAFRIRSFPPPAPSLSHQLQKEAVAPSWWRCLFFSCQQWILASYKALLMCEWTFARSRAGGSGPFVGLFYY